MKHELRLKGLCQPLLTGILFCLLGGFHLYRAITVDRWLFWLSSLAFLLLGVHRLLLFRKLWGEIRKYEPPS